MYRIFHDTFPVCADFAKYWADKWEKGELAAEKAGKPFMGLVVPYPLGGHTLISSIGFSKKYRRDISTDSIVLPNGERTRFSRLMNVTETKGAPTIITAVARMCDSAILYATACYAAEMNDGKPVILDAVHDEIEYHPNDSIIVNRASMQGSQGVFSMDIMETGKPEIVFPKDGIMYRQG